MTDLKEIKKQIISNKLKPKDLEAFLDMLPKFGSNFTEFVYLEASKLYFELLAPSLVEVMKKLDAAQNQVKAGNIQPALDIIDVAPDEGFYGNGEFVLPWVLDIKKILDPKSASHQRLSTAISEFEAEMITLLKKPEIAELIKYYAFYLINRKVDLLGLLKKAAYLKHWDGDPRDLKPVQDALLENAESVSEQIITLGDKQVPLTLGNAIKDFVVFSPYSATGRSAYDISKYFISSKTAASMDAHTKDSLLEAFKLFLWLQRPIITEKEIEQLLELNFRRTSIQAGKVEAPAKENKPVVVNKKQDFLEPTDISGLKIFSGQPSGIKIVPPQKPKVDIDKKLEDLRKKVTK